ncbi:MAG: hypothetical protein U0792_04090 [Gemmataceae bacterium]
MSITRTAVSQPAQAGTRKKFGFGLEGRGACDPHRMTLNCDTRRSTSSCGNSGLSAFAMDQLEVNRRAEPDRGSRGKRDVATMQRIERPGGNARGFAAFKSETRNTKFEPSQLLSDFRVLVSSYFPAAHSGAVTCVLAASARAST